MPGGGGGHPQTMSNKFCLFLTSSPLLLQLVTFVNQYSEMSYTLQVLIVEI